MGALRVQELRTDEAASEALFLRACRLGIPPGCTNAHLRSHLRGRRSLGLHDAGLHLMNGIGIDRDVERAARVLGRSCDRYGEADPACTRARELLAQLKATTRT